MVIEKKIQQAAEHIRQNGLVIFPTETVYGIGANAYSDLACQEIFKIKNRPMINPLIVHVATFSQAYEIGYFSEEAKTLVERLWPGPISVVVKLKDKNISKYVTSGLETIAIRMPCHDIAQKLITEANLPIAAPSANPSNYISATSYEHVFNDFTDKNIIILEGDDSKIGIESTIVDLSIPGEFSILRPGFIQAEDIIKISQLKEGGLKNDIVKAPGMLKKHYSPKAKLYMNMQEGQPNDIAIEFGELTIIGPSKKFNLSISANLNEAAANLYKIMRQADLYAKKTKGNILVTNIPNEGIGFAINDKITRASSDN